MLKGCVKKMGGKVIREEEQNRKHTAFFKVL